MKTACSTTASFRAVVLAGGSGTRFWPASRRSKPKHVLPLLDGKSTLQRTIDRLLTVLCPHDVVVVTAEDQLGLLRDHLPELPEESFIAEPAPRNTAACIGLSALLLSRRDPPLPMLAVPSDHHVADDKAWLETMVAGCRAASVPGRVALFGVRPTHPHTGYGYLHFSGDTIESGGVPVYRVNSFKEKPDLDTARTFLAEGGYFWNSGCFAFMPGTVLELFRRRMPELASILAELERAVDAGRFRQECARLYPGAPSISFDYGVLEGHDDLVGLELDAGWTDLGCWSALYDLFEKDCDGNVVLSGEAVLEDCRNSLFWCGDTLVAAVGLSGIAVAQSDGVILVCPLERAQEVRRLVKKLKERGLDDHC